VSSREIAVGRWAQHVIASDTRLQRRLGGARISLHARVARLLLELVPECGWHINSLRPRYQQLLSAVSEVHVNQRPRMTDQQVRQFVSEELAKDPKLTGTRLLRRLRESGRACEQNRFKALFAEVRKRSHGA
jgi:hypothetical protein